MKVLSFDPGQVTTGYAILEMLNTKTNMMFVKTGKLNASLKQNNFAKDLKRLLAVHSPDYVAFEQTGAFLSKIYNNIVHISCSEYGIPVLGCTVQDVRQFLFGDRHMSKTESNILLKNFLDKAILNLRSDISKHELDAVGIAFYAIQLQVKINHLQENQNPLSEE